MKKLTCTAFVDGKPWDTLTEEEQKDFHDKSGERLEEALTEWFNTHDEKSNV